MADVDLARQQHVLDGLPAAPSVPSTSRIAPSICEPPVIMFLM
jgi:hypothetical protein